MRRPPQCVAFVARTHWTVGLIIVGSIGLLHLLTRNLPAIEFGPRTYAMTGGLAALYLLTGTLVWFGAPFGRLFSRVCALLYLPRPQFGSLLWETMNSPEFKAHFTHERKRGEGAPANHANRRE
jgi:hypothetical protein